MERTAMTDNQHVVYIKNMVCPRCIESVQHILSDLQIDYKEVRLGEVQLFAALHAHLHLPLKQRLLEKGFDLLEDKKSKLVEKVKTLVLGWINAPSHVNTRFSDYLAKQIGYDYSHISGTFTEHQGLTIERFLILQKIEKAKELLTYKELNLNEIADLLHYSSAAALSTQFKEVTGLTPTDYKKQSFPARKPLDEVGR